MNRAVFFLMAIMMASSSMAAKKCKLSHEECVQWCEDRCEEKGKVPKYEYLSKKHSKCKCQKPTPKVEIEVECSTELCYYDIHNSSLSGAVASGVGSKVFVLEPGHYQVVSGNIENFVTPGTQVADLSEDGSSAVVRLEYEPMYAWLNVRCVEKDSCRYDVRNDDGFVETYEGERWLRRSLGRYDVIAHKDLTGEYITPEVQSVELTQHRSLKIVELVYARVPFCGDGSTDVEVGEYCDDGVKNGEPNFCNKECDGVSKIKLLNINRPNDSIVIAGSECQDLGWFDLYVTEGEGALDYATLEFLSGIEYISSVELRYNHPNENTPRVWRGRTEGGMVSFNLDNGIPLKERPIVSIDVCAVLLPRLLGSTISPSGKNIRYTVDMQNLKGELTNGEIVTGIVDSPKNVSGLFEIAEGKPVYRGPFYLYRLMVSGQEVNLYTYQLSAETSYRHGYIKNTWEEYSYHVEGVLWLSDFRFVCEENGQDIERGLVTESSRDGKNYVLVNHLAMPVEKWSGTNPLTCHLRATPYGADGTDKVVTSATRSMFQDGERYVNGIRLGLNQRHVWQVVTAILPGQE